MGTFYDWDTHLAEEGYLVLAARLRRGEEEATVRQIIHQVFKREVKPERLFQLFPHTSPSTLPLLKLLLSPETASAFPQIAWTSDLLRLGVLVGRAWQHNETVLLVGVIWGGKTTTNGKVRVTYLICVFWSACSG